ncbi:hypothetical protein BH23CHL8_BH23CHL8_21200 [soil metagenome]
MRTGRDAVPGSRGPIERPVSPDLGPSSRHVQASRAPGTGSLPPVPPSGPVARVAPRLQRGLTSTTQLAAIGPRIPFGFPNLRRNVCPHFYMTGPRGPIPVQSPHLLKAYMRQDATIARCQVRGGVHLDSSFVSDVCLSARFNQCVFYEEDIAPR